MSKPAGFKKLWKNMDWESKEEKRAFFNKYFNSTKREFVVEEIKKSINSFKNNIIGYMESDIIEKDKPKRKPTFTEIMNYIKNLE